MFNHPHPADEDLLGLMDRELEDARSTEIERHLRDCTACLARYRTIAEASSASAMLSLRAGSRWSDLTVMRGQLREGIAKAVERRHARWAPVALGLTAALLFLTVRYESAMLGRSVNTRRLEQTALPVATFTPGAARDVSVEEVCRSRSRVAPLVSRVVRLQVLRDYGMEQVPDEEYELDYLITPELGGIPDRRNLWPERYGSQSWNAYAKDALEHVLPQLVCSGRIDLVTAQREMAADWITAYKKYLETERPVQLHARLLPIAKFSIDNFQSN